MFKKLIFHCIFQKSIFLCFLFGFCKKPSLADLLAAIHRHTTNGKIFLILVRIVFFKLRFLRVRCNFVFCLKNGKKWLLIVYVEFSMYVFGVPI